MTTWLRRIRGVLGTGLSWAAGWALFGVLIGVASKLLPFLPWHHFFAVFDAPLPALAIPGFVGGALFSTVLGIAEGRRRFDELSLPRFAAWGAVGGVLLSLVPAAMVAVGLASIGDAARGLWELTAVISGPLALLSAASASGSLLLARRAEKRELLAAGAEPTAVGLTEDERLESRTCTSRGESPAQRLPKSCSTRAMRSIPKCSATRSRTVARVPTRSASWAGIVT